MGDICTGAATNLVQRLADQAINEAHYLCCFDSYVKDFENKQDRLSAKLNGVKKDIDEAIQRNENRIEDEVQEWKDKAEGLVKEDTKTRRKWFYGWCPNCIWQYQQGKELAEKTQEVIELIDRCNFNRVARSAELPNMEYYSSSQYFVNFESRKSELEKLTKALEDENCYMIGLQGIGGTGKTTLAIEVGRKVEESTMFEKVIFVVVSNPPDFKKIRGGIAKQLGLRLEEAKEEENSKMLWSRIANNEGKVLIILDDVWDELNLRDIGIPFGQDHNNCCVMITTRDCKVCEAMRCQSTIQLQLLDVKDALNLFLKYADVRDNDLKSDVARKLVQECGRLPVAIVALASTLKNCPLSDWKAALTTLQNCEPLYDVHEDLTKVYKSLRLSYENLKNEKAQKLFLICSLFVEDFEIPIELLSKVGIGVGIFGEVNNYSELRRRVIPIKNDLIKSSLLLEAQEECVKMHDWVRSVALWIANNEIQAIMDSKTTLKSNVRYLLWDTEVFPTRLDGTKLEILILSINVSCPVLVPDGFFAGMTRLRVLILFCANFPLNPAPSLAQSLQPLKDIRTVILSKLELGEISILKNLQTLETLELDDCSIIELPKEIKELRNLRLLGLRRCKIGRNNPFEVIERCSRLEELYFVDNCDDCKWSPRDDKEDIDEISQHISPLQLQRYAVSHIGYAGNFEIGGPISRCFEPQGLRDFISEATFKYLVGKAEVLALGNIGETRWRNLIPDIVLMDDGGMNDLMKLALYSMSNIDCLIDTTKHPKPFVTAFSSLVELRLSEVDVQELYHGHEPSGFLKQLHILKLKNCTRLHSILLRGQITLCHLKVMELENCPMVTSLFHIHIARSLVQLEVLKIKECSELKYITEYENSGKGIANDDNSLFPKLKTLRIARCDKLDVILPVLQAGDLPILEAIRINDCKELKYIVWRHNGNEAELMMPSLKEMELSGVPNLINIVHESSYKCMLAPTMPVERAPSTVNDDDDGKEKHPEPTALAFSWARVCCFRPTSQETDVVVPKTTLPDQTSQELHEAVKLVHTIHTAECLLKHPLNFRNIRRIILVNCSNLVSLFSLPIAMMMILLETLTIDNCHELKHIITNERDDHGDEHSNCNPIFPKLESLSVSNCNKIEFLFPSAFSGGFQNLKFMYILEAPELRYVFGKYNHHEDCSSNGNIMSDELHFDLPALEYLSLQHAPNIISICSDEGQTTKESHASREVQTFYIAQCLLRQPLNLQNTRDIHLVNCSNLTSLFTLSIATAMMLLERLKVQECHELKYIVTNKGEHQEDRINLSSIFPKLEKLEIFNCRNLEFIFPSTFSGGLESLKSMIVEDGPELKYVFGKCHNENIPSNGNKNDELLRIDLPAMENLCLQNVPKIISICDKKYFLTWPSLQIIVLENCMELKLRYFTGLMVCSHEGQPNLETSKALHASIDEIPQPFHQNNIREIKLFKCWNLISLFTLPVASSLTKLEVLTIEECFQLKHIVADEGDAEDDHVTNYDSNIFPNLKDLNVLNCHALEFLFPVRASRSLMHLESLNITIFNAPQLKYLFGTRHDDDDDDDGLCDHNKNVDDTLVLKRLFLEGVPNLVRVCPKNYQTGLSVKSIVLITCPQFIVRCFDDFMACWRARQEDSANTRAPHGSTDVPPLNAAQCLLRQPLDLHNIREMIFENCSNFISLFTTPLASATTMLEFLKIRECHNLKYIVTEEGDGAQDHVNYNSIIFPNLKVLNVVECQALEFLLPARLLRFLVHLKSLNVIVSNAPKLKYVFGTSHCEDNLPHQNQNVGTNQLDLPALEDLGLVGVPNLVRVCPRNYYVRGLSLKSIVLNTGPQFIIRSLTDFMVCRRKTQDSTTKKAIRMRMQNLNHVVVENSKVEEIFDLDGLEIETPVASSLEKMLLQNLNELRHICKGPKYILSLHNLKELKIIACNNLRTVFSASTSRSLPQLCEIEISDCEELVHIIEDDCEENNISYNGMDQPRFPTLYTIIVRRCHSLKWLFSISKPGVVPLLQKLEIEEAFELEQVFRRPQGDTQKMAAQDVFPTLLFFTLKKLPRLVTIYEGLDFPTGPCRQVVDCPKYQGNTSQTATKEMLSANSRKKQGIELQEFTTGSPNLAEGTTKKIVEEIPNSDISAMSRTKKTLMEIFAKDSTPTLQKPALATSLAQPEQGRPSLHDLEDEKSISEPILLDQQQENGETKLTVEVPQKMNITFEDDSIEAIAKERVQEGPTIEDAMSAIQSEPEGTTSVKAIAATSLIHSQHAGSLSGPSSPVTQIIKKEVKQGLVEHYPTDEAITEIQSTDLDPRKKSARPLAKPIEKESAQITKEAAKGNVERVPISEISPMVTPSDSKFMRELTIREARNTSVQGGTESKKTTKAKPLTDSESQIGVGEILQLVELKDRERPLLAKALEQYPHLRLRREQRSDRIIALSYRVLVDILVMLATKTPYTITTLDKLTLEANLGEAIFLGFDKDWVELVRAKVLGVDMSDVWTAKEAILAVEAEVEACDTALEGVQKQREKVKERLVAVQSEFEAIDDRMMGLLEGRKKLVIKTAKFREIISAKNTPFGL